MGRIAMVVAQEVGDGEPEQQFFRDTETPELSELSDPQTILDLVSEAFSELAGEVLGRLPLILIGFVVLLLFLVVIRFVLSGVNRGMRRGDVDFTVRRLVSNLLRITLLLLAVLLAFAIAGVEVGAMLAALGLIGLGVALALQNILENLISGILILMRKPYDRGEVIITAGLEGFVEDIDLRVTTIRSYDGTLTLVPNADIYRTPLTNLSRRGTRRSAVQVGIDYRDDHERARDVLWEATNALDEVLEDPPPMVLLTELGDSSVDFEIRFWTDADSLTVVLTKDAVLRACKTAVEQAGMTIPWPIRTLAADKRPLQVETPPGALGRGQPPALDAPDEGA
ncbi:MAG: mechanosensitive ion channel family protein [Nitriliruptoraceae bacterium]